MVSSSAALLGLALVYVVNAQDTVSSLANSAELNSSTGVQDDTIELNHTRYKLKHISIIGETEPDGKRNIKVGGDAELYPNWMTLIHPNFWSYWIHAAFQFFAAFAATRCPKFLLVILVLAVLCWPISAIFHLAIWRMERGSLEWWLMFAKSLIVNIAPTVPMMYCLIWKPSMKVMQGCAIWTYIILFSNVLWTLLFLPMAYNTVNVVNSICGVSLAISLAIRLVALIRRGCQLWEVQGDILYGYGVSLSWVVCYTVWNALFVVQSAVCITFQDIAFWAMMVYFFVHSNRRSSIENYFTMARPISLSAYIATTDWPGLIDFFNNATPLGLDATRHAFFLFTAICNVFFSIYVFWWECCLCHGKCCGADEYYARTFGKDGAFLSDDEEASYDEDQDEE